jgi:hypothetical protein
MRRHPNFDGERSCLKWALEQILRREQAALKDYCHKVQSKKLIDGYYSLTKDQSSSTMPSISLLVTYWASILTSSDFLEL